MLIADDSNGRVRIITPGGTISTIAGSGIRTYGGDGGPAARASMSVSRVSVDNADNMYIADGVCNRIRKIGNYRLLIGSTNGIAYTPVIVYPNPATNVISIELPAPLTVASTVNLYNLSGQKVLTTKFEAMQSKTLQLSIGSLPEAVYTAEVVAGGNPTYYAKVVLLR